MVERSGPASVNLNFGFLGKFFAKKPKLAKKSQK
jgi:hypothetical protein